MNTTDPPPSAPYSYPGWETEKLSLFDVLSGFLRNRWILAASCVTVASLVAGATILSPETWSTNTSFMSQGGVEGGGSRLENLATQFGVNIPGSDGGQSPQFYSDLLTSREILGDLTQDTFTVVRDGISSEEVRGTLAELRDVEIEEPARRRRSTIGWLRREVVSVNVDNETGVVELRTTTEWPHLSAELARRLVELVNEFNLETRQSQAAAERRFIEERMEQANQELQAAEKDLEQFLTNNRQFENSPRLVFRHDRLQRKVSMRQQVYTSLAQAHEEARMREVRNTPVITVIEEAEVPVKPDSRQLPLRTALGLVLGGILGMFIAGIREYIRTKKREHTEDYDELSTLWYETIGDLKRLFRRWSSR